MLGRQVKAMKDYDEKIINAFMYNTKQADISKESGLSVSQVKRLKNNADFQRIIRQRKDAIIKATVNKMRSYVCKDVDILQGLIEDPEINPQTRIYAISQMMHTLKDWLLIDDLVSRMDDIEKEQKRQRGDFFEINS
jgi:hypothetical protein